MKTNNSSACQSAEGASAKRGRAQRPAPTQSKRKTMKTDDGSAAQSAAGTPAKPSRASRIINEIRELGHMPRESSAVGASESLLAGRLRRALSEGAFKKGEKAEIKRLQKEFDERKPQQLLDEVNRLGHYPRQSRGTGTSEKLLASKLNQALQDGSLPSAVKNELERLRHDDDERAYQQDPKDGFVEQDLDKGSLRFNFCRPETISSVLQQAIKSWPGRLRGLRFWLCNRDDGCMFVCCPSNAPQPADWLSPIPTTFFAAQLHLVAERCPELEQLRLEYLRCKDEPDPVLCDAIEAIATSCPRLRHLDLDGNGISKAAMQVVAKACPQLECLNIECIESDYAHASCITDDVLDMLAKGCPKLKLLDVTNRHRLTDAAVRSLVQHCPGLKVLLMDGCLMLTLAAAHMLDQGYANLEYVSIKHLCIPADILKDCFVSGRDSHSYVADHSFGPLWKLLDLPGERLPAII